jgi:muramoyltetrapeptide carboxypeptidase
MKCHSRLTLPPPPAPGARVAVVAPAGACNPADLAAGLEIFRAAGLDPHLDPSVYGRQGYLAGADTDRAAALMKAFLDPAVAAIACARGGYGSMRLLDRLDFLEIARHPKRLLGFSDLSALLWALNRRAGLAGFHGPTVASLAEADRDTVVGLDLFMADDPHLTLSLARGRVLAAGWAVGTLCGGNLTTLCHLMGTPFAPCFHGAIVVLEDRAEAPYRVDRLLTQLRLGGALDGARAVVLGDFTECGGTAELHPVFEDRLGDLGIPVMTGLPVGHGPCNLTLPLGLNACLDTSRQTLAVGRIGRP